MSVFWPLAVRKFNAGSTPLRPTLTSSYQFPGICTPRFTAQAPPHTPSLMTADGDLTETGRSFTSGASYGHFLVSNASRHERVENSRRNSLLVASVDKRRCLAQKGWCGAVDINTLITTRQYVAAIQRYQTLGSGEKGLSVTLQRQLLGLCGNHSTAACTMSGVDCSAMALILFETIRKTAGVSTMEDSLALMNTLANHNRHERVFKTYQMLRRNGLTVTPELLHIVLHSGKHLGKRAFILLLDIKQCSLPPEEEAKFVQRFMESLDPVVFDTYVDIFGTWLEESDMAAAKISVKNVTKLLRSLASKCLWRYATLLLRLHSQHVPELGAVACECVVRMVRESPALGRDATDIVDNMSEGQMMSLNSETWNMMLKQCAEDNEIHRVSKFYALLHKNKRFISQQVLATVLLMYIHQKKEVEAAAVLKNSLEENPPSLPPLPVLTKLCQALEDANACKELHFTVAAMIENHSLATSCYLSGEDGVTGSTVKAVSQPTPIHSSVTTDSQTLAFTQGSLEAKRISLEECLELQQFEALTDKYSLLHLIERNARQGQFGAVASVLVTLTERQMLYSTCILDEILEGLTLPGVDLALAFWYIVSSFRQCQLSTKECRPFHGHCILSNLGAALLLHCEHHRAWDKGFQVLYCLHVHGIWYINNPRPIAGVLQRHPLHISDCNIALAAVNICLKTNNPAAAIQVLNCCGWVKASGEEVVLKRAEYVMTLLQHCIRNGVLSDAQKCLTELLDSRESCGHLLQAISSLGNKLVQLMLRTAQEDSAAQVWKTLQNSRVLIPTETFSNLLACFMRKGKREVAKGLCGIAISQGHYGELAVNEDVSTVRLPAGLTRIEVYCLLESHLLSISDKSHEQLTVLFVPDAGQTLEMVLTKDFVPSLHTSFSTHRATISAVSIQKWRKAHSAGRKTTNPVVKVKDRLQKKHLKHHFRVAVCKGFVTLMKPYYQAKRFKTDEDYTHLLRVLSTNYFKSLKSKQRKTQWKFADDTKSDIKAIVSQVMNSCSTYSKDVDLSFGPIQ